MSFSTFKIFYYEMAGHDSEKDEWVHENEGAYIADESLIHNFLSTTEQREGVKAFIYKVKHEKVFMSNIIIKRPERRRGLFLTV